VEHKLWSVNRGRVRTVDTLSPNSVIGNRRAVGSHLLPIHFALSFYYESSFITMAHQQGAGFVAPANNMNPQPPAPAANMNNAAGAGAAAAANLNNGAGANQPALANQQVQPPAANNMNPQPPAPAVNMNNAAVAGAAANVNNGAGANQPAANQPALANQQVQPAAFFVGLANFHAAVQVTPDLPNLSKTYNPGGHGVIVSVPKSDSTELINAICREIENGHINIDTLTDANVRKELFRYFIEREVRQNSARNGQRPSTVTMSLHGRVGTLGQNIDNVARPQVKYRSMDGLVSRRQFNKGLTILSRAMGPDGLTAFAQVLEAKYRVSISTNDAEIDNDPLNIHVLQCVVRLRDALCTVPHLGTPAIHQQQIDSLNNTLAERNSTIETLTDDRDTARTERDTARTDLDTANTRCQTLETQLATRREQKRGLRNQIEELNKLVAAKTETIEAFNKRPASNEQNMVSPTSNKHQKV